MRLRVLIADDEPLAREDLKVLLRGTRDIEALLEARNGREAVAAIREQRPDLVLLDVQMPRMGGLDVVKAVGPDRMPPVIFVTAHDRYAICAFEISAVDYLLKPVTQERFCLAFARAKSRLDLGTSDEAAWQMRSVLDAIANPGRRLARLVIRSGERAIFLPVEDVDRIEAAQNYVRIHSALAAHLLHVPMNTIEASLDPSCFVRIHRSHIVNVKRIKQVWTVTQGQFLVELVSGERIPTGRTYGERIRQLLSNPF
ncbi:MAG TPA: LytTR family DNA-binding domain-containing protein [Bryobacteraceae bacterium]|nr:LytTR family DNA-binding domain-containing protein [Bryobacteraceae bacterium]